MTGPWEIRPLGPGLAPQAFGRKAMRLGEALAAGLPVPPGIVLDRGGHTAARAQGSGLPAALKHDLAQALQALPAKRWAVRTTAADEDEIGASAAGLYHSELGARDLEQVCAAVQRCYAAAEAEAVRTYRTACGATGAPPTVAVLIQAQVEADWAGVLFTRDPRRPAPTAPRVVELVERSTSLVTAGLAEPQRVRWTVGDTPAVPPTAPLPALGTRLARLAEQAESLLGTPADVEWAFSAAEGLAVLQLRPISRPATSPDAEPAPAPPAHREHDGRRYTFDPEHNPEPLSPLHASLVAHLEATLPLPFHLRVLDGYLYSAPADAPPPPAVDEAGSWWQKEAAPALALALHAVEEAAARGAPLHEVLAAFDRFYERYAVGVSARLGQSQATHRARLGAALTAGQLDEAGLRARLAGVPTPLSRAVRDLGALATAADDLRPWLRQGEAPPPDVPGAAPYREAFQAHLAELGGLAAAWDVACPTLGETPAVLHRAAARAAAAAQEPRPEAAPSPLRETLAAGEKDDLFFARALAALRRIFLDLGRSLTEAGIAERPDDVFGLPLESLLALQEAGASPPMPDRGARPASSPPPPEGARAPVTVLRGVGCGAGVHTGRVRLVHRLADLFEEPEELGAFETDTVVVCPTLLPSSVPALLGVRAVVTDHGGLLSHGAILARELGLAAVLGTRTATRALRTGDQVWLDADRGLVVARTGAPNAGA